MPRKKQHTRAIEATPSRSREMRIDIRTDKVISYAKGENPFHDGTAPASCAYYLEADLAAKDRPWTVPQEVLDRCKAEARKLVPDIQSDNKIAQLIALELSQEAQRVPGNTMLRGIVKAARTEYHRQAKKKSAG